MGLWLLLGFLGLIALNMPIAHALTVICAVAVLAIPDMPLALIPQRLFTGSDVFILLAVPFFILAGQIMEQGGVAKRVIRVADDCTRFVTGGLGHVTVLANMFFAGISGSAVADTAALGPLSIPMMVHGGFPRDYATALVAVASVIGIIIPPSIPMVIYGMVASESITRLFLGGMIPGILIGLTLMVVNFYKAHKYQWGTRRPFSLRDLLASLRAGILALVMPGIIVGGILFGIFTPTEAAVIAVVYALLVAMLAFQELPLDRLPRILLDAGKSTATIMYIIAAAGLFAWILTYLQLHVQIYEIMTSLTSNKTLLLILIVVVYLIAGFVMDLGANIIILVPIFMPLVRYIGIDMTHFGLITIVALAVGLITPPVAVCTIVAAQIGGVSIEKVFRASFPLLGAILVALAVIMFVPDTVLFLPRLLMH
jgi:tripartite ATP-independent transporter DctM subunit